MDIKKLVRKFVSLWSLGAISLLAIAGYIFYALIWVIRLMQTKIQWLVVFFLICCLFLGGAVKYLFLPAGEQNVKYELTIPEKASLRSIADSLVQKKVITNKKAFLFWLKISGLERKVQAGKVSFVKGEGALNAAEKLLNATPEEVVITIPEGLTIFQTAKYVSNQAGIDTTEFLNLCQDTVFIRSLNIAALTLEGYLFPNTYRFGKKVSVREIIKKMVSQFEKVYSELEPDPKLSSKYSKHEFLTLASIVEKEATLASERTRISGVFHNRLRIGYPLGADPTIRYALRKFSGPLRVSELKNPSPYNTRNHTGLPPGPICSPGKGALQAAVAPMDTKELYFVAKWDGSGEHDFSLTNEEHDRKKFAIRRQNELRKKQKQKAGN
ncbi:MAG: endolytic transglycosylase MltG [Fibrobacter sp.]|nr:endolytic transglycosylase MltG [Fibrobacter sp.]